MMSLPTIFQSNNNEKPRLNASRSPRFFNSVWLCLFFLLINFQFINLSLKFRNVFFKHIRTKSPELG